MIELKVIDAIIERKSIRKYSDKKVSRELIKEVLEAGRLAPSSRNTQPWKFYVITEDSDKEKLRKEKVFFQEFVLTAPVIIVCCSNQKAYNGSKEELDNTAAAVRDVTFASSFMVLRAQELGLRTCFVGWMEKEKIKEVLSIPKEFIVPYCIVLGYGLEEGTPTKRKVLKEITFNFK
ncbi:MAG: nitroreductase family protein [archaeon]